MSTSNTKESTSPNSNTESGGLLNFVKNAASSVLGFGDKDKLNDPIDLNESETKDKESSSSSLKDKILSKADELLEHNPEVEKTDKVNVNTDEGLETTTSKKRELTKDTKEVIKEPEDVDELNKENEVSAGSTGLTGKAINLVSSAVHTVESAATFISEKTLGHERTETIRNKATDLLESTVSKLGLSTDMTADEATTVLKEKASDLKDAAKQKLDDLKSSGSLSDKLSESKAAAKEMLHDVKEEVEVHIPEVSTETHKKLTGSAARRLKARKAKLAKQAHHAEEKVKDTVEKVKTKAKKELHEMKSNLGGKNKAHNDEKVDNKHQMEA